MNRHRGGGGDSVEAIYHGSDVGGDDRNNTSDMKPRASFVNVSTVSRAQCAGALS